MKLTPGDVVLDFYTAFPPVAVLRANQVRSVAGYLKNYRPAYVAAVHAAGIGFTPIFEAGETSALGGAPLGAPHGRLAVAQAKKGGIPAGVVIIFTHDSSAWSPAIPAYFQAAEREARAAGYGFGGYMSKQVADACRAIGVVIDISWAPAAYAWGGGRDPQAHVWQKPSSVLPGGGPVDMGVVKRTVDVWVAGEHTDPKPDKPETVTPPPAPRPPITTPATHQEDNDMANIGIITLPDAKAQFIGQYVGPINGPRFLHLDWINSPAMVQLRDEHIAAGATVFGNDAGVTATPGAARLVKANLRNCIVDTLPVGDELTTWASPADILVKAR